MPVGTNPSQGRMEYLYVVVLVLVLGGEDVTSCPNTSATSETKSIYLLTLVSVPDDLGALSGACIAQDEINNRTDILSGYHIELIVDTIEKCSLAVTGGGLSSLVKYTVNPPCHPVVAVNGLGCSSHTSVLSPVAGHGGFDLIQLTASNSPIFQTRNNHFPHLWQFLGSASIYSDTILAIMDQYNWNRIGVVFDRNSVSSSEIVYDLYHKIQASPRKKIEFYVNMRETDDFYLDAAISNIKNRQISILVSLLNLKQSAALLARTVDENLVYPDYTWLHVDRLPQSLGVTPGHFYLHIQTHLEANDTVLVSGETFASFKAKHNEDIKLIKQQYNDYNFSSSVFASHWYDQVWAIALAVNNSVPLLASRNLSIDYYSIGQPEITNTIEEKMAYLSFQGAGGWVKFNNFRSVSTSVEVYWLAEDGTGKLVGLFDPHHISHFFVLIDKNDLPKDRPPSMIFTISLPVAIFLYLINGIAIVIVSIQLILYMYYFNHKVIKPTSPHLNSLVFVGCFFLCLAALLITVFGHSLPSLLGQSISFNLSFLLEVNGHCLILVTIFIKLLRVYRIFLCVERQNIGKFWKNAPLFVIAVTFSLVPNVFVGVYFGIRTILALSVCIGFIGIFIYLFLFLNLFLAIRTRKIRYKEFKETKTVTFFIALMIITFTVAVPLAVLYIARGKHSASYVVRVTMGLAVAIICQLILITPKLLQIFFEKHFSMTRLPFFLSTVTHITTKTD